MLFNVKINSHIQTMHGENSEEVLYKLLKSKKYDKSHVGMVIEQNSLIATIFSNDLSYSEIISIRKKK